MKLEAALFVVRGNNDKEWAAQLPESLKFELNGIKFFLIHNKKEISEDVDADVIIYGHSHKYSEENVDGHLWLNPGSCGKRRFNLPVTMAVIDTHENGFSVKKIEIVCGN